MKWLFSPVILIPLVLIILVWIIKYKDYKDSAYYRIAKNSYFSVMFDLGRWGEYLTYRHLKKFEKEGAKFLFNIYVPKENGETTEIDILMISKKGIFVFESKNYSGWIFGSEGQKNWYQTLPAGRGRSHKEHFYNPIMQNRSHIKHLRAYIGEQFAMYSIIVFSDRCTLKSVGWNSADVNVINRHQVEEVVSYAWRKSTMDVLTENEVASIYEKLYPLTQNSEEIKKQHILNIQNAGFQGKYKKKSAFSPEIKVVLTEPLSEREAFFSETVERKETQNSCPRCGGKLVLRTAKKGANAGKQFWGCSNYPKCRFITSPEKTEYET